MNPHQTQDLSWRDESYEAGVEKISEAQPSDGQLCFENNLIVTLEVGPGKSLYHVHKGLLCHVSPVFDAAFNGSFKENSGSMQLWDDDVATFEYLVQWLYKRKIIASTRAKKDLMVRYSDLVDLYLLADKYGVLLLKNHVMKSLFERVSKNRGTVPDTEVISHVYANTMESSRLRAFLVACWAWGMPLDRYGLDITSTDLLKAPEFGADLAIALALRICRGIEADPFKDVSTFLESADSKPKSTGTKAA